MIVADAVKLINHQQIWSNEASHWADLGCGTGLFTKALASILTAGSLITAVDKNNDSLKNLKGTYNDVTVETLQQDFTTITLDTPLDGILMANSLHYVTSQNNFIKHLKTQVKKEGSIIIVEYDTEKSNPWVPYPVNYNKLKMLFEENGFINIEPIGRQKSVYGAVIYSVIIKN
jgi:ubiquinone/menaquinone biosynthesis C-methylase UbiE